MASEASVAGQTADGQVEEKEVINDTKNLGENVCHEKESGGIGESGEPRLDQPLSSETDTIEKTIEDEKDETRAAEEVKKEHVDDKDPASGALEDKKDDAPVVGDVEEENGDIKVLGSEVSVKSEDGKVENVKEKAETGLISSSEVPKFESSKADEEGKTRDTAEPLIEAVENQVVGPEISSDQELEQAVQESEVAETVIEVAKATKEHSDIIEDPALALESVDRIAVAEPASDATGGLEQNDETHEANKVLEASKDEKVLTNDVAISSEVSKGEVDVKETGDTSASRALDVDAVPEKNKEPNDDDCSGGRGEETKNEGSGLSATESLVKELTVDPTLSKPSAVVGEAVPVDDNLVTEAAENAVRPEAKIETQSDAMFETEPVEEHKEEKTVATEAAKEQKIENTSETVSCEEQKGENNVKTNTAEELKEEKTLGESPALIAADETGDLSNPADEVATSYVEDKKNSESADKVAEEQRDYNGSDSAIKTTEIPSEKEKASEVPEAPKDDSVTENVDKDKPEKTEKLQTADVDKDEAEDKEDESEEIDTQKLAVSSKDDPSSKTDVEAQKSETPAKPKTLISKLKRSIVKVKKAIIGKSPSSKMISAESKEVSEVR